MFTFCPCVPSHAAYATILGKLLANFSQFISINSTSKIPSTISSFFRSHVYFPRLIYSNQKANVNLHFFVCSVYNSIIIRNIFNARPPFQNKTVRGCILCVIYHESKRFRIIRGTVSNGCLEFQRSNKYQICLM